MAFVGPVMSFYQPVTDNFERLTDEEWTKKIDEDLIGSMFTLLIQVEAGWKRAGSWKVSFIQV